ncbi:MAG: hypothetical protein IRY99_10210 [Isosphaeraceae bacterium]|nr:hypothetical protein [Isosphaeraceae bacterium]
MSALHPHIIVEAGECACQSVHTTRVHHRDFPEIWSEASSASEGAEYLAKQLARAAESARSQWHRDAIQNATADVNEFLKALREAERRGSRVAADLVKILSCPQCAPTAKAAR